MNGDTFTLREQDIFLLEHYRNFLPRRIFDVHTHMHLADTIPSFRGPEGVFYRAIGTPEAYCGDMLPLLPGTELIKLNMMPMPDPAMNDPAAGMRERANNHVAALQREKPEFTFCPYILPGDTGEKLENMVRQGGAGGFKCYCYGAGKAEIEEVSIGEYLPQEAWEVADQNRLPIILHMMRPAALADPENNSYIVTMAKRYSGAKLVLAHCARAFASWTAVETIQQLEDCGNIWFDLAAICESTPMMACILKNAGKRTMWGSDYPICMNRGRAVSVASGSTWLTGEHYEGPARALLAAENLMALYQTALLLRLDQTQLEDIFYNNAMVCFRKC